jgi:hypothetical protein
MHFFYPTWQIYVKIVKFHQFLSKSGDGVGGAEWMLISSSRNNLILSMKYWLV